MWCIISAANGVHIVIVTIAQMEVVSLLVTDSFGCCLQAAAPLHRPVPSSPGPDPCHHVPLGQNTIE